MKNFIGVTPYIWDLLFLIILIASFTKIKIPFKSILFNLIFILYFWFILNITITLIIEGRDLSEVLKDFRYIFYYFPLFLLAYSWFKISYCE